MSGGYPSPSLINPRYYVNDIPILVFILRTEPVPPSLCRHVYSGVIFHHVLDLSTIDLPRCGDSGLHPGSSLGTWTNPTLCRGVFSELFFPVFLF